MATVRKGASGAKSVSKKQTVTSTVRNVRQPTKIGDMADTNFGVLDETKDGLFVTFNNVTKTFELTTADDLLSRATEDSALPDEFISQVESEINLVNLQEVDLDDIDGGTF